MAPALDAVGVPVAGLAIMLGIDRIPLTFCVFKGLSGLPCPTCGSTRTVARLFDLDPAGALAMNPFTTVVAVMRVPGLGPKKAAALYKELNIATLDQLKAACEAEKVRELKGFGAKTEQTILHGISIAAAASQRMTWAEADDLAEAIRAHLSDCKSIQQLELAGSYRRGKETVGDLDVLVVPHALYTLPIVC